MVSSPHEGLDRGDNTRAAGAGAGVSGCVSTSGPSEVTGATSRIRADILVIVRFKNGTQEWSVNIVLRLVPGYPEFQHWRRGCSARPQGKSCCHCRCRKARPNNGTMTASLMHAISSMQVHDLTNYSLFCVFSVTFASSRVLFQSVPVTTLQSHFGTISKLCVFIRQQRMHKR